MANKPAARGRVDLPVSPDAQQRVPTQLKSSSFLDTRVVYCGDWRASHYVKVMLN
jgi:hypothetical protein